MTANGWRVVEGPKVLFPTYHLREGFGEPRRGGSIRTLGEMFGLSAHNEALIVAFCLACLKGSGPYPTLLITGPEGYIQNYQNIDHWVHRFQERPAYKAAIERAGYYKFQRV
jgi:hypothetical protein